MKLIRSSLLVKLAILIVVVYAAVTLVSLQNQTDAMVAQEKVLERQVTAAEQTAEQLKDAINSVDSDEAVAQIARNKLGLVSPGEIVFYDIGN